MPPWLLRGAYVGAQRSESKFDLVNQKHRFVPETKRLHLEQVDTAFSMPYSKVIPERYAGILKPIRWRFMTKNKNKKQSMQFEGSSRKDIESDVD